MAPGPADEHLPLEERKFTLECAKHALDKAKFDAECRTRELEEEKLERELHVLRRSAFFQPGYLAFAVTLVAAIGGIYVAYRSDYYRLIDKERGQAETDLNAKRQELGTSKARLASLGKEIEQRGKQQESLTKESQVLTKKSQAMETQLFRQRAELTG